MASSIHLIPLYQQRLSYDSLFGQGPEIINLAAGLNNDVILVQRNVILAQVLVILTRVPKMRDN